MRPSSRDRIVETALRVVAVSPEASLTEIAEAAGVTKQGLLYHFPDRQALREAMLALIFRRWEQEMERILGCALDAASPGERISAYARLAARGTVVEGESVVYAEIVYRSEDLSWYDAWVRRWFFDDATDRQPPARLAAWVAANGLWSVMTSGKLRLDDDDVRGILAEIDRLVGC